MSRLVIYTVKAEDVEKVKQAARDALLEEGDVAADEVDEFISDDVQDDGTHHIGWDGSTWDHHAIRQVYGLAVFEDLS